jgi:nucleoid-associated protein YgaU
MPSPARKLSAAAVLIAGGVACAWPFRLPSDAAPDQPPETPRPATAESAGDVAAAGASLIAPPANLSATSWLAGSPPLAGDATAAASEETSVSAATASLAQSWSGGPSSLGAPPATSAALEPAAGGDSGERIAAYRFAYPSVSVPPPTEDSPAEESPVIRYVIHEGDSLAKLAQRYLGDESRALELFDHNRQTLENPYLLPIGAEIEIPRQRRGPPSDVH